jgi:hypothetical protein
METFLKILQHHANISINETKSSEINFTEIRSQELEEFAKQSCLSNPSIPNYQLLFYMKTIRKKYEEVLELSKRKETEEYSQEKTNEYPFQSYVHHKFDYIYKTIIENIFLNKQHKDDIENIFFKTQRTYHIIKRALYRYRFYKAPTRIQTDLCLNAIDIHHINTFILYKNKVKYCFAVRDLIHIIITAITNSFEFFMEPIDPKNPYTNIPFTKADLYNMYFCMKKSSHIIPPFITSFFILNFDLDLFTLNNEGAIRENTIKKYVMNSTINQLYIEIMEMIDDYFEISMIVFSTKLKMKKKEYKTIVVDKEFPKERLVNIMCPYLYMYLMSTEYITGTEKRAIAKRIFKHMIRRFINFNPNFGRKCINKVFCTTKEGGPFSFITKLETTYKDEHPSMTMKETENLFSKFNTLKYGNDDLMENTDQYIETRTRRTRQDTRNRRTSVPINNQIPSLIPSTIDTTNVVFESPPLPRTPSPLPSPLLPIIQQTAIDLLEETSSASEESSMDYSYSYSYERNNDPIVRNDEVYDISFLFESPIELETNNTYSNFSEQSSQELEEVTRTKIILQEIKEIVNKILSVVIPEYSNQGIGNIEHIDITENYT